MESEGQNGTVQAFMDALPAVESQRDPAPTAQVARDDATGTQHRQTCPGGAARQHDQAAHPVPAAGREGQHHLQPRDREQEPSGPETASQVTVNHGPAPSAGTVHGRSPPPRRSGKPHQPHDGLHLHLQLTVAPSHGEHPTAGKPQHSRRRVRADHLAVDARDCISSGQRSLLDPHLGPASFRALGRTRIVRPQAQFP